MKRTKRVFIIAVIFSMVFGLVACGGSTTSKYPVEEQALTIEQFSNPDYDYEDYQKMFPSGFVVKKRNFENSRLRVTVSNTARENTEKEKESSGWLPFTITTRKKEFQQS